MNTVDSFDRVNRIVDQIDFLEFREAHANNLFDDAAKFIPI